MRLIDADKLIEKLKSKRRSAEHKVWNEVINMLIHIINQQPTTDGWIPVSERLPKEKGWYQCSCYGPERWSKGLVRDLYWYPSLQQFVDNIRYSENGFDDIKRWYWTEWVKAWQPLPQPYKESE